MLRRVALVTTNISQERIASIIRATRIGVFLRSALQLLVTANVVNSTPNDVILNMEPIRSTETSVLTRTTRRNIPEDGILHCHRCENLKSCNLVLLPVFVTTFLHISFPISC
jgi:hypothetical protein